MKNSEMTFEQICQARLLFQDIAKEVSGFANFTRKNFAYTEWMSLPHRKVQQIQIGKPTD